MCGIIEVPTPPCYQRSLGERPDFVGEESCEQQASDTTWILFGVGGVVAAFWLVALARRP